MKNFMGFLGFYGISGILHIEKFMGFFYILKNLNILKNLRVKFIGKISG